MTRHADIVEIERRHDVFKNTIMAPLQSLSLTTDWFKPSALRQTMGEKVASLTRIYIDKMLEFGGECDFAVDIAQFYPLRVIMAILGIPEQDEPLMLELSQRILAPEDPEFVLSEAAERRRGDGAVGVTGQAVLPNRDAGLRDQRHNDQGR